MANESTELQKTEAGAPAQLERTETPLQYLPRTDVYENDEALFVVADMPGVDEKTLDIQVERNVLSVVGHAEAETPEGFELDYGEYRPGSFVRQFTLPVDVDVGRIDATVRDGVGRIRLPKSEGAKPRKVAVRAV